MHTFICIICGSSLSVRAPVCLLIPSSMGRVRAAGWAWWVAGKVGHPAWQVAASTTPHPGKAGRGVMGTASCTANPPCLARKGLTTVEEGVWGSQYSWLPDCSAGLGERWMTWRRQHNSGREGVYKPVSLSFMIVCKSFQAAGRSLAFCLASGMRWP